MTLPGCAQRRHIAHGRAEELRLARGRAGGFTAVRFVDSRFTIVPFVVRRQGGLQISPRLSRYFCASSAAMQPVPALVTAWR